MPLNPNGISRPDPKFRHYLPWGALTLILYGLAFITLEDSTVQPPQYDIASTPEAVEIEENEPPSIAPSTPQPQASKQIVPPPAPEDIPVPVATPLPTPAAIPEPTTTPIPRNVVSKEKSAHKTTTSTTTKPHVSAHDSTAENALPGYLNNPSPPYPEFAKEEGQEGTANLLVSVDVSGHVTGVRLEKSSGFNSLDASALETVKKEWKFRPANAGGIAIPSHILVPIHFKLSE